MFICVITLFDMRLHVFAQLAN